MCLHVYSFHVYYFTINNTLKGAGVEPRRTDSYSGYEKLSSGYQNNNPAKAKKIDEEVRKAYLRIVSQHNNIYYQELESTYSELSKNSTSSISIQNSIANLMH